MDNHRRHRSAGEFEGVRNYQPFYGSRYHSGYSHRGRCDRNQGHYMREHQQHSSYHSTHRDRSRSPIIGCQEGRRQSNARRNDEGRRQPYRRRESYRGSHYHKHHYDVQKAEPSSAFKIWDDQRLKDLARNKDPNIVEVLFNDQIAFLACLIKTVF